MKDIIVRLADESVIALREAESKDLPGIVDLLADDPLGSTREGTDTGFGPYERAFADISVDPRQLLVVAVDEQAIVGTLQLTVIPGFVPPGRTPGSDRSRPCFEGLSQPRSRRSDDPVGDPRIGGPRVRPRAVDV